MQWLEDLALKAARSIRDFALSIGEDPAQVWRMTKKSVRRDTFMRILCKARKESGKTWNELGVLLDREFLDGKRK